MFSSVCECFNSVCKYFSSLSVVVCPPTAIIVNYPAQMVKNENRTYQCINTLRPPSTGCLNLVGTSKLGVLLYIGVGRCVSVCEMLYLSEARYSCLR